MFPQSWPFDWSLGWEVTNNHLKGSRELTILKRALWITRWKRNPPEVATWVNLTYSTWMDYKPPEVSANPKMPKKLWVPNSYCFPDSSHLMIQLWYGIPIVFQIVPIFHDPWKIEIPDFPFFEAPVRAREFLCAHLVKSKPFWKIFRKQPNVAEKICFKTEPSLIMFKPTLLLCWFW